MAERDIRVINEKSMACWEDFGLRDEVEGLTPCLEAVSDWVKQNKLRMQDGATMGTNIIWFYECFIYYSRAGAFPRTQLHQEFAKVQNRLRHLDRLKFRLALHSCLQILICRNQFTLILFGECTEMTTAFSQRKTFFS